MLHLYSWETSAEDRATLLDDMVSAYRSLDRRREAGVYSQDLSDATLRQVQLDVDRSFTERDGRDRLVYHREALTRILHAFLLAQEDLDYVQGMSDIACKFPCHFDQSAKKTQHVEHSHLYGRFGPYRLAN